jgi:hypothetical protein
METQKSEIRSSKFETNSNGVKDEECRKRDQQRMSNFVDTAPDHEPQSERASSPLPSPPKEEREEIQQVGSVVSKQEHWSPSHKRELQGANLLKSKSVRAADGPVVFPPSPPLKERAGERRFLRALGL